MAKTKRKKSLWDLHVEKTRKENPDLKFPDALKEASKTFKKK
jgi:hypothetical protein|tara:strand:- start:489 stop:614 length:126 start_codon:yes stop_codon:yes gene_type:complete